MSKLEALRPNAALPGIQSAFNPRLPRSTGWPLHLQHPCVPCGKIGAHLTYPYPRRIARVASA